MDRSEQLLGAWGESLAGEHLRKKHYRLLALNFSCRLGEIDLIAQNRKYVVFVEVKLRKDASFARAAEFVDPKKQERIRKTAELWLSRFPNRRQPRFDVIEIYAPEGIRTVDPDINHLEDAFS